MQKNVKRICVCKHGRGGNLSDIIFHAKTVDFLHYICKRWACKEMTRLYLR